MAKKVQYTTNDPSANTDYLAADNTWKPMSGGGGGVPTTRTLTINGTTQDLSADRTWTVGDMLTSVYDTDVDGVVDSAERIEIIVRNSTGSTITKGKIVYLSGATGNRPNAVLAQANSEATSSKTIGMVTADIPNNTDGSIAVNGTLHDIDTSSFSAGDSLWLSATTAGGYVANTPPAEPNHAVFIGYVARVHPTQGRIVLNIQNGYELDELHGVQITSVANGQVLTYNSTSGLWENANPSGSSSSKSILNQNHGSSTIGALGVSYGGWSGATTLAIITQEFARNTLIPLAGTIKNWAVLVGNQPATGSLVFTLRVNSVDTAMTITIAAGSLSNVYYNNSTSISVAAGSAISFKAQNNASTTSGAIITNSIMYEV